MKRILFLHQDSNIGGGSYCLLNILREIDKTNIKPIVCLVSNGPLKEEIEKLGIEVILFPQMSTIPYNKSLWSINSLKLYYKAEKSIHIFKQLLIHNKIDVVYLNNMMIYKYLQPAKECGCKTILHCREHWPLNEHTKQLQWARKAVQEFCDKLIAINQYSASIFSDKEATIIYDWIDMESRNEFRPMNEIFEENVTNLKIYLFTGGFQRIKGAYQVLKVFHNDIKDPNSRLLVLGYDMKKPLVGIKVFLKKFLFHLGFDINEIKCRKIIEKDKRIVCIPSTYMITHLIKQSFCMLSYFTIPHANLALAESLILGTNVIAARTEEAEEYSMGFISDNLFEINNIADFKLKIKKLNQSKNNGIDKKIREAIQEKLSKSQNVEILNKVLSEL